MGQSRRKRRRREKKKQRVYCSSGGGNLRNKMGKVEEGYLERLLWFGGGVVLGVGGLEGKEEIEQERLRKEMLELSEDFIKLNDFSSKFKDVEKLLDSNEVMKDLIDVIVEKIIVRPNRNIEIVFRHKGSV